MKTFGVFQMIGHSSKSAWHLVSTHNSKAEAEYEAKYLRDYLGLVITVFVKL
jgi:hypothetical protein